MPQASSLPGPSGAWRQHAQRGLRETLNRYRTPVRAAQFGSRGRPPLFTVEQRVDRAQPHRVFTHSVSADRVGSRVSATNTLESGWIPAHCHIMLSLAQLGALARGER